jgi:cyclophilin family peptidyl-prolyl cis-trans isomerase
MGTILLSIPKVLQSSIPSTFEAKTKMRSPSLRIAAFITCVTTAFAAAPAACQQKAAQTEEAPVAENTPTATSDAERAQAAFTQKFDEYKSALRDIEQLRIKYQTADAATRKQINAELSGHIAHAQSLVNALVEAALAAYRAAPDSDPQVTELLTAIARYETIGRPVEGSTNAIDGGDQYEKSLPIIKALVDGGNADRNVLLWGFISAFATGDYDLAEQYLQQAQTAKPVEEPGANKDPSYQSMIELVAKLAPELDNCRKLSKKENAIRAAEAKADDLPRVKLITSKGEITLELFENEAPQTVANFLSLVKQGFYTDSPFHRVLPGFMAQGGAKTDQGEGGPGYMIRCECYRPDARMHFRGSLSMAHAGRDTGNSQFFLTFVPTPHLNGRHTVFGRVIEGMEVLGDLQRRDPQKPYQPAPDRIIKAEVIRDRGHEYKFDKLPGR